ncbi:MAG: glycosyl transferase family 2 [Cereibacter sphaeroides]|uniref:Glycosyl transferase family 2 n=1 Tax=Cereibacter sphaeroides TaxID=1063 RepID=A0A2W5SKX9_CERSP|nr:MAG: glycosyl transferase family 2 [Cereibacter sphaeroides]
MSPKTGPEVIRRSLGARMVGGLPLIEAVTTGNRTRAFFGTGCTPATFAPDGSPGCDLPLELREVSGGTMVVSASAPTLRLALSAGGAIEIASQPEETEFLAGRNVILAFRLDEPAETVAEGLLYHTRHHGLTGALIVSRAPPDGLHGISFAAELAEALADSDLRVVVVHSAFPLGSPDLGPESHPYLAPDAPGRERMVPPEPDPWRSPLGQGILPEALKWRFLARANAVLTLDVTDILAPRPSVTPNAFDLCRLARNGVILLVGRRIYPWRVRQGQQARFGDHICRPFDARRGIARWGVAPDIAGLDNTWRPNRVAFARPDPGTAQPFFRAMAIRVPGRTTAELVPKTSLIEDPALISLATGVFAHSPVRAPKSAAKPLTAAPNTAARRTAIVTTMKNEGPFILEWLAYHRAIGVSDFLIYTNDCTDGTDLLLNILQSKGLVQHRDNPFHKLDLKPQHAALQAAEEEPVIAEADWAICMDVDEYLNIKIGDGTLPALYAAMEQALPGANMISATWRLFGNADVHGYQDRFLLDQFTRCAPELIRKPHQAWGFKTLFRTIDIYKKLGVHRPKGLRPDLWTEVRWMNGSGRPMPQSMFRNGWRSTTETFGYDWVQLNHYACRSAESFLVKRDRGRVNHVDRDQGLNYWFRMNHNVDQDRSIQRMIPALRAEYNRLMSDPEIAAAHAGCVAAHRQRIAELRATEAPSRFYAELTGERMQSLCRMQHHFGSAVFTAGPGVIPQDLHLRDLPANFFFTIDPAAAE